MYELITESQPGKMDELECFVRTHPKGHFLQSPVWRKVKTQWGWRGVLVRREGQITGALSLLIRRLPVGISLLYAPRGPVCDPRDRDTLEQLFQGAREAAKAVGGCALLLDADILESDHAFWTNMDALGFQLRQVSGFDGTQPRFVFRLDIAGKSEEEIFSGFASKTRYQIRLARRRGVEISCWAGDEDVPEEALSQFAALMEETGRRDHFLVRSESYFCMLLEALGPCARLYLARLDSESIAGTIAVQYGDKTWYLYGASSNQHRDAMPNYLLQWEMIRWAISGGCRIYDFRGVSGDTSPENPLYGLYRFKKGFGGDFTAFCGEYIQVYRPLGYQMLRLGLWANQQWRKALRGRR
ncbi:MAG: lipid II:glycine glycyltransferase FemX [Candidatus Onthomonas sp.]